MARCPSCEYPLPENRERVGARCPSCRDPLYEPPGPCGRCGNYLCEVCRTRWRDQVLCPACVERALSSDEATPEQAKAAFRQALVALLLGSGSWVFALLAFVGFVAMVASSEPNLAIIALFGLSFVAAIVP